MILIEQLRNIVRLSALLALINLSAGCMPPEKLQPIAEDNFTNIQNLVVNNKYLHGQYRAALVSMGDVELILRVRRVQKIVIAQYGSSSIDDIKPSLMQSVDQILQTAPVLTEERKRSIPIDHPIVGDIAIGVMSESVAVSICKQAYNLSDSLKEKKISQEGYIQQLTNLFGEIQLIREWKEDMAVLLRAYDDYINVIDKQAVLARNHARVIKRFSSAKPDFAKTFIGTLTDSEFQGTMLGLTDNEKTRRKIESVFDCLNNLTGSATMSMN